MRNWFLSLEHRERLFVSAGGIAVVFALLYVLVWAPIDRKHAALEASVDTWQRSLAQLKPLRGMNLQSGTSGRPLIAGNQTPVVIVDRSLRSRGLDGALQRSQPTGSDGIRVEFENVAFDDLVLWLDDLGSEYSMHVASASVSISNFSGPGRVIATFTLERAP